VFDEILERIFICVLGQLNLINMKIVRVSIGNYRVHNLVALLTLDL